MEIEPPGARRKLKFPPSPGKHSHNSCFQSESRIALSSSARLGLSFAGVPCHAPRRSPGSVSLTPRHADNKSFPNLPEQHLGQNSRYKGYYFYPRWFPKVLDVDRFTCLSSEDAWEEKAHFCHFRMTNEYAQCNWWNMNFSKHVFMWLTYNLSEYEFQWCILFLRTFRHTKNIPYPNKL